MKKTLLTLTLIAVFTHFVSAQALQFVYNEKALADNEIVTITDFSKDLFGDIMMKFAPKIKNNTKQNMQVQIIKNEVELPNGYTSMCFGQCTSANETPLNTINANSETDDFYAEFFPEATATAKVKYTAKEKGLQGASTTVEVHYKYVPSGIKNVGFTQFAVLQGGGTCRIIYSNTRDVQMTVYSITGEAIGSYMLPASGTCFDMPITDYKGIAILSFTDKNGKTAAEKIILK